MSKWILMAGRAVVILAASALLFGELLGPTSNLDQTLARAKKTAFPRGAPTCAVGFDLDEAPIRAESD